MTSGGANAIATERAGGDGRQNHNPGPASHAELRTIQAAKVRTESRRRLEPVFAATKGMDRIDRLLAISGNCPFAHKDDRAVWSEVMAEMEEERL